MDLPLPPIEPEVDLTGFAFMPLNVRRLRDSRFAAAADGEAFRTGVLLWCAAWHQVPAGSLPDDDVELANLAGFGRQVEEWQKVRSGALYGWRKHSDGRLYHRILVEAAREAWGRREEWQEQRRNDEDRKSRYRERLKELSAQLRSLGVAIPKNRSLEALEQLLADSLRGRSGDAPGTPEYNDFPAETASPGTVAGTTPGTLAGTQRGRPGDSGDARGFTGDTAGMAKTGTGNRQGEVRDRDRDTLSERGRVPGTVSFGEPPSPRDAWRDVTECDPQAYETWLNWRTEEHDVVPPRVRIQDAKFLAGKGSPEQQRTFVDELIRLRFKRLHDPIGASNRSRGNGGRPTFDENMAALDADIAAAEGRK